MFDAVSASLATAVGFGESTEERVALSAILAKKGSGTGVLSSVVHGKSSGWKLRKFELVVHCRDGNDDDVGPVLRYYDATGEHYKGSMVLDGSSVARAFAGATKGAPEGYQSALEIKGATAATHPHALAAPSDDEACAWVTAMRDAIADHAQALTGLDAPVLNKRRASIAAARDAADGDEAAAAVADAAEEARPKAPLKAGSSLSRLFYYKNKKAEAEDAPPALKGVLRYRTVAKGVVYGSRHTWRKRTFELHPKTAADVGPVIRWHHASAPLQILLSGVTCEPLDGEAKTDAYFRINHGSYAEPKDFSARDKEHRDAWVAEIKECVAEDRAARDAASADEGERTKMKDRINRARRTSITLEETVAHDDDPDLD